MLIFNYFIIIIIQHPDFNSKFKPLKLQNILAISSNISIHMNSRSYSILNNNITIIKSFISLHKISNLLLIRKECLSSNLCYNTSFLIFKRTMMLGRCVHSARAAFHCLQAMSTQDILNKTQKNNYAPLAKNLALLSIDDTRGTPQHKEALVTHMIKQKFPSEDFYEPLRPLIPKLSYEPNTYVDARVIKETQVISTYVDKFDLNIDWILATCDSRSSNFPYQKQTNQDWWVNLKTNYAKTLDHVLGFGYKVVAHDEKAGQNMFKHSTRGSLGLLTYDSHNRNVQIMSNPISHEDLIKYIDIQMSSIREGLKTDNKNLILYNDTFNEIKQMFNSIDHTNFNQVQNAYEKAQNLLWTNIQCDMNYNRSISFVFLNSLKDQPLSNLEENFHKRYLSLLQDRLYNLDKKSDRILIFRAMLIAYRETIDPQIISKFNHLKNGVGIDFTNTFTEIINSFSQI